MRTYSQTSGDGGSGILEQILEQRSSLSTALSGVRHLLAVGSGKGGVGKSTLTLQLALSFRAAGRSVAVLDADFNGPSIARIAGLGRPALLPGARGLLMPKQQDGIGVVSLGALLAPSEALTFHSVSRGDSFVWRASREFSLLIDLIAGIEWGALDVLLLDLPPGPERTFHYAELFGEALSMVLVTAPSALSQEVVERSATAVSSAKSRLLGVVENMKGYLCPRTGELLPLFPETGSPALQVPRLGEIPFEPRLAALCDTGLTLGAWETLAARRFVDAAANAIIERMEQRDEIPLCSL